MKIIWQLTEYFQDDFILFTNIANSNSSDQLVYNIIALLLKSLKIALGIFLISYGIVDIKNETEK